MEAPEGIVARVVTPLNLLTGLTEVATTRRVVEAWVATPGQFEANTLRLLTLYVGWAQNPDESQAPGVLGVLAGLPPELVRYVHVAVLTGAAEAYFNRAGLDDWAYSGAFDFTPRQGWDDADETAFMAFFNRSGAELGIPPEHLTATSAQQRIWCDKQTSNLRRAGELADELGVRLFWATITGEAMLTALGQPPMSTVVKAVQLRMASDEASVFDRIAREMGIGDT
ncbi:MAG TPA: hypothetical protein VLA88_06125 [Candidatus Saccharimonadales bacterium]|nr:hypothetical protein [Candidatus Saccharimonadales bacterium]